MAGIAMVTGGAFLASGTGLGGSASAGGDEVSLAATATLLFVLRPVAGDDRSGFGIGRAVRALIVAVAVGVGSLLAGTVLPIIGVGIGFLTGIVTDGRIMFVLGTLLFGAGLVLFAWWFLRYTGRHHSYIDVGWPSRADLLYGLGGVVGLVGLAFLVGFLYTQLNVPTADHSVEEAAGVQGAEILLWSIPLAWIAIALGEELVFRGVVQRYLAETFRRWPAIVLASGIFAIVHIPAYFTPNPTAMASVLVMIFGLSIILGWTYERTENLLVPIFIHGTYNAIVFYILYLSLA